MFPANTTQSMSGRRQQRQRWSPELVRDGRGSLKIQRQSRARKCKVEELRKNVSRSGPPFFHFLCQGGTVAGWQSPHQAVLLAIDETRLSQRVPLAGDRQIFFDCWFGHFASSRASVVRWRLWSLEPACRNSTRKGNDCWPIGETRTGRKGRGASQVAADRS